MNRGAWQNIVHGVAKESDMTWRLNNIVNYSHHVIPFIPIAYLFCNWKLYLLTPLTIWPTPPHLCLFSVCELGAALLDSTYEWDHKVFVSLYLISLSLVPSKFIHIVENGKNSFFLMAEWYFRVFVCEHEWGCIAFQVSAFLSFGKHSEVELLDHLISLF